MVNIRSDLGVGWGEAGRCGHCCRAHVGRVQEAEIQESWPKTTPAPQPMSRRRAFSLQSSGPFHLCAEPHSLGERLLFLVQLEEEKRGFKK